MSDYERIARIIRWLDEHHLEQPDLAQLAALAGLSPHHFHRLFSRWAGVTPKDFLQCLTLTHAREQLRRGGSVLDAALDAGLSAPSRLHDLCLTLEAATPGEIKTGGAGWTLNVGFADTPFGICCAASGPRGILHLAFVESADRTSAAAAVSEAWPLAALRWDDASARDQTSLIFRTAGHDAPLRAFVSGTPFQVRVWRALLHVPRGDVISYGRLARAIGQPAASRAVGSALARNSLAFLIPCHRVIRDTGITGHYRWGPDRKRAMLAWEAAQGTIPVPPRKADYIEL